MASRVIHADLDAWFADFSSGAGNGRGTKMGTGMGTGAWAWQNRIGLRFPKGTAFDGVAAASQITGAAVNLHVSNANFGIGGSVKVYLERATGTFTEYQITQADLAAAGASNANAIVSTSGPASGEWPGPATTATDRGSYEGSPSNGQWVKVQVGDLVRWWYANRATVGNLWIVGKAHDETATAQRCTFDTRESSNPPFLEITLGTNRAPNKPTDLTAVVGADGRSLTVSSTYTDPDGDVSTMYEVVLEPI